MSEKVKISEEDFQNLFREYPQYQNYFLDNFHYKKKIYTIEKETLISSSERLGINFNEIIFYLEDCALEPIKIKAEPTTNYDEDKINDIQDTPPEKLEVDDSYIADKEAKFEDANNDTDKYESIDIEIAVTIEEIENEINPEQEIVNEDTAETEEIRKPVELDCWKTISQTVVGKSHLKKNPPIPCQDSAICSSFNRPALFLSDGAGSAQLSHFGSNAIVNQLNNFLYATDDITSLLLDNKNSIDENGLNKFAERLIKQSIAAIRSIALHYNNPFENFRATVLTVVFGKEKLFWLKLGDGWIILQKGDRLETIGSLGKGEYANETTFIHPVLEKNEYEYGVLEISDITGVALLSDGAGEKLVSNDGKKVASLIESYCSRLVDGKLNNADIFAFFTDGEVWKRTTGDDKGIAMAARR